MHVMSSRRPVGVGNQNTKLTTTKFKTHNLAHCTKEEEKSSGDERNAGVKREKHGNA